MGKKSELTPIVKWAGGKEKELKYILPKLPINYKRYIEPFVGGGAVYFSIENKQMLVNDKSEELIKLYLDIKNNNDNLISRLQNLQDAWTRLEDILDKIFLNFISIYTDYKNNNNDKKILKKNIEFLIKSKQYNFKNILKGNLTDNFNIFEKELIRNFYSKLIRMANLEAKKGRLSDKDIKDNFECALKSAFYMFIRELYNKNKTENIEYFYFIREYCYSSMFRYNANGNFNVPYGGISYNRKNFQRKIDYLKSKCLEKHFSNTEIYNMDFENFLEKININKNDFMFIDPPYDTNFSSYANNSFDEDDQRRLANYLIKKCEGNFMIVIKNTDLITSLYKEGCLCKNGNSLKISSFEKKYMVSFKNRNNKDVEHLLITNY